MPPAGSGHIHLTPSGLSSCSAAYPLKLLAPRALPSQPARLRCVYSLAYGGGLVDGDVVQLSADVDAECALVLLTQGSTKVFKRRAGRRLAGGPGGAAGAGGRGAGEDGTTRQRLLVRAGPGALVLVLPDAVSPFRSSRFAQAQRFVVPAAPAAPDGDGAGPAPAARAAASVLVLDWVNSGRGQRRVGRLPRPADVGARNAAPDVPGARDAPGAAPVRVEGGAGSAGQDGVDAVGPDERDTETWAMDYYASTNEIVVGSAVVMRERLVLDASAPSPASPASSTSPASPAPPAPPRPAALTPLAHRLAPYHVYATLLILGPQLAPLLAHLARLADGTSQFQLPRPPGLVWSFSPTGAAQGVVRLAAGEVEDARAWIRALLEAGGVRELVGDALWPRCI